MTRVLFIGSHLTGKTTMGMAIANRVYNPLPSAKDPEASPRWETEPELPIPFRNLDIGNTGYISIENWKRDGEITGKTEFWGDHFINAILGLRYLEGHFPRATYRTDMEGSEERGSILKLKFNNPDVTIEIVDIAGISYAAYFSRWLCHQFDVYNSVYKGEELFKPNNFVNDLSSKLKKVSKLKQREWLDEVIKRVYTRVRKEIHKDGGGKVGDGAIGSIKYINDYARDVDVIGIVIDPILMDMDYLKEFRTSINNKRFGWSRLEDYVTIRSPAVHARLISGAKYFAKRYDKKLFYVLTKYDVLHENLNIGNLLDLHGISREKLHRDVYDFVSSKYNDLVDEDPLDFTPIISGFPIDDKGYPDPYSQNLSCIENEPISFNINALLNCIARKIKEV